MYGLQQAPRHGTQSLINAYNHLGHQVSSTTCVYNKGVGGAVQVFGIYVDDLIITWSNVEDIAKFKKHMKKLFDMSDLGLLSYYLGIEVKQDSYTML